jgi:protein-disulfide isomerase
MTNARASRQARAKAAALRAEQARLEARRRGIQITAAIAAVMVAVLSVGVLVLYLQDEQEREEAAVTPTRLTDGQVQIGKASAPVTIRIYEDFYCPLCGEFERANSEQISDWIEDGTVKVQYHTLAIMDHVSPDSYSTRSAAAGAAVWDTTNSTVWRKFHDKLFEKEVQPEEGYAGLTDQQLIDYAIEAGAKADQIKPAITDQKFGTWVEKVTDQSSKDKVTGTPTALVNGKKLTSWSAADLKKMVDQAKSEKSKG